MANFTAITKCRICGSKELISIGGLGMIAVSDFTAKPEKGNKLPLELVYCPWCTLVQLAHNFNRQLLYKDYWYRSGLNKAIVADLKEIAAQVTGPTHIDIGSNDGTLLSYSPAKIKFGVDPSNIVPNGQVWIRAYWEKLTVLPMAQTITAIACLYDLPDPNAFMKNIKLSLAQGGVFISQFQPLSPMIELNDIGNICHEHLEFYSYQSLVYLFEQNGLEIFKVEKNAMNGGSYRVFARHFRKGSIEFEEPEYGIKELRDFMGRVEDNKKRMIDFVMSHRDSKIVGFGASTKAATICQYYDLAPLEIVDVNPDKAGKHTVYGSQVISKIPPDTDYLWVFPYGFLDYFKKKEKGFKGKWVTSIPKFIVT